MHRDAEKALAAGVDGVIAVAGGARGHTGTINPFALMNEVRRIHSGPVVLAGGMTTGRDLLAAQARSRFCLHRRPLHRHHGVISAGRARS